MNTNLPKVIHEVCGRPMLAYVLDACRLAGLQKLYVVIGYGAEKVKKRFSQADDILWVEQRQQKGTAHAVMCCKPYMENFDGEILVLCGDGPLIRAETLQTLIKEHQVQQTAATLATAVLDDPTGYGRIIRDANGSIQGIVEHSDCTPEQLAIREVNPSYYIFDNKVLFEAVDKIKPDNVKNEYYLTDVLSVIIAARRKVGAVTAVRPEEAMGVNSRDQLGQASKIMQRRIQRKLMNSGVTIVDPDNTWIDARAQIGADTVIEPFVYIHGEAKIGCNVNIGAGTIMADPIGQEAARRTKIGDGCSIGAGATLIAPLDVKNGTHIRPGAVVANENAEQFVSND